MPARLVSAAPEGICQSALCRGEAWRAALRVFWCQHVRLRRPTIWVIILLADDFPIDRFGQHQLEVPIGIGLPDTGAIEFLDIDPLQSRHKLEAQEAAEREGDRTLTVRIHVLPIDFHLGAMMNDTLDH